MKEQQQTEEVNRSICSQSVQRKRMSRGQSDMVPTIFTFTCYFSISSKRHFLLSEMLFRRVAALTLHVLNCAKAYTCVRSVSAFRAPWGCHPQRDGASAFLVWSCASFSWSQMCHPHLQLLQHKCRKKLCQQPETRRFEKRN